MPIARRPHPALIPFLALFAAQSGFLVLTPTLPALARDLGVSTATAGALRIASGLAGAAVALSFRAIVRRLGLRDMIAAGLLGIALASAASALAPSYAVLAAAQVAVGAGGAIVVSGGVAAAARWSAPGERARVLAWTLLGQPAAWVAAMPVVGALEDTSWRLALAVPVAAAMLALVALSRRPAEAPEPGRAGTVAVLRGDLAVAGWAVGELLACSAWGGTLTFAGALMAESYGISAGLVGVLLAAGAAAYFPGSMLARRRAQAAPRPLLVLLGAVLAALVAVFGAVRPGLGFSVALFAVLVALAGARTLAGSAAGLAVAPRGDVAAMSIRAAALQLGYVVGGALGGAALSIGGYPLLGAVLGVLFAGAALPHLHTTRTTPTTQEVTP
jgi:predicted MFS family arabinose efflux permease